MGVFTALPAKPTTAQPATWGSHRDATVKEIGELVSQGCVEAYTDGSAKQVQGWMQAGYGVYYWERSCASHGASKC